MPVFDQNTKGMGCIGSANSKAGEGLIPFLKGVKVSCNILGKKDRPKLLLVIVERNIKNIDSACWSDWEMKTSNSDGHLLIQRNDLKSSRLTRIISNRLEDLNKAYVREIEVECPQGLEKKERGHLFKALSKALIRYDSRCSGGKFFLRQVYLTWEKIELSQFSLRYRQELLAMGVLLAE